MSEAGLECASAAATSSVPPRLSCYNQCAMFFFVEFQKVPKTICFPLSFNKRHIFLNIDKQSTSEHLPDTQKLFGLGVRLWSHHTSKPFLFCCVLHHLLSTYLQILQSNTLYNFQKAGRGLELPQNRRYFN